MVTGENKKKFEEWGRKKYYQTIRHFHDLDMFYKWLDNFSFEMQIGVYLSYYDSLDIRIGMETYYDMQGTYRAYINRYGGFQSKDRNEAYKEAFKKADEIINKL
jgi:hypothetical protein